MGEGGGHGRVSSGSGWLISAAGTSLQYQEDSGWQPASVLPPALAEVSTYLHPHPLLRLYVPVRVHVPQHGLPRAQVLAALRRFGDGQAELPARKKDDATGPEAEAHEDDEEGEEGDEEAERDAVAIAEVRALIRVIWVARRRRGRLRARQALDGHGLLHTDEVVARCKDACGTGGDIVFMRHGNIFLANVGKGHQSMGA